MDAPFIEQSIAKLVYTFHAAQDGLDESLLRSCFVDDGLSNTPSRTTLDLSEHFCPIVIQNVTVDELWNSIKASLFGFTATIHAVTNIRVELPPDGHYDRATVRTHALAYHCISGLDEGEDLQSETARVHQTFEIVKQNQWVISSLKVARNVALDNPGLYELAAKRAKEGNGRIPVQKLSDRVEERMRRCLATINTRSSLKKRVVHSASDSGAA